jgi:CarD family transcriptional regulator
MTLRVPTAKIASVGMRKLAEPPLVRRALETLKGRARIKRTMWSRRAQEYEAKINSGDIVAIAEVVRDLFRSDTQPEQSHSERQLYEAALDRLSREISVVQRITETEAIKEIEPPRQGPASRSRARRRRERGGGNGGGGRGGIAVSLRSEFTKFQKSPAETPGFFALATVRPRHGAGNPSRIRAEEPVKCQG